MKYGVYKLSTVFRPRLVAGSDDPRRAREEMERLSRENRSAMYVMRKKED